MSTAIQRLQSVVSWRDPHSVSPAELAGLTASLERACRDNPDSADLHTCLGMAYAMNFEAYKSMDALNEAVLIEPGNFMARLKLAELHYRLRCLDVAAEETSKALALAQTPWELSLARRQMQEIRRLRREGTQKPAWTKPLLVPAAVLFALFAVSSFLALWW